jgi:hypothetical protein
VAIASLSCQHKRLQFRWKSVRTPPPSLSGKSVPSSPFSSCRLSSLHSVVAHKSSSQHRSPAVPSRAATGRGPPPPLSLLSECAVVLPCPAPPQSAPLLRGAGSRGQLCRYARPSQSHGVYPMSYHRRPLRRWGHRVPSPWVVRCRAAPPRRGLLERHLLSYRTTMPQSHAPRAKRVLRAVSRCDGNARATMRWAACSAGQCGPCRTVPTGLAALCQRAMCPVRKRAAAGFGPVALNCF